MGSSDPFNAPVVSSLSVRVLVDSVFDQFMPKATHPMCTIEHVGRIRNNLNSTLAGLDDWHGEEGRTTFPRCDYKPGVDRELDCEGRDPLDPLDAQNPFCGGQQLR